jgi:SAM-dependent methyltransferase
MDPTSYDLLWRTVWGDLQRCGPVHRHSLKNLVRAVSELDVKSVLDVGCGSGESLAALAALGRYQLTGVDVSQEALRLARRLAPSARLLLLDIERQALSEQFDLVISIQVVEHLLDDIAAFRNMARMAHAYVLVSTMQGRMRPSEIAIGHMRNYSAPELQNKLEQAGLEVLKVWGWGFPFYSPIVRSLVEWLPGGPPAGPLGPVGKLAARALYHLYRLNLPGRGDVLSALARPRRRHGPTRA